MAFTKSDAGEATGSSSKEVDRAWDQAKKDSAGSSSSDGKSGSDKKS